jgi:hypothetical protein
VILAEIVILRCTTTDSVAHRTGQTGRAWDDRFATAIREPRMSETQIRSDKTMPVYAMATSSSLHFARDLISLFFSLSERIFATPCARPLRSNRI